MPTSFFPLFKTLQFQLVSHIFVHVTHWNWATYWNIKLRPRTEIRFPSCFKFPNIMKYLYYSWNILTSIKSISMHFKLYIVRVYKIKFDVCLKVWYLQIIYNYFSLYWIIFLNKNIYVILKYLYILWLT